MPISYSREPDLRWETNMRKRVLIIFNVCVFASAQALALNLTQMEESVEEQFNNSRSCNELYLKVSVLEKEAFSYETDKGERTQITSAVSTVFAPALYLLGYSAIQDYRTSIEAKSTFAKIEEVRYQMAEKRCFEK